MLPRFEVDPLKTSILAAALILLSSAVAEARLPGSSVAELKAAAPCAYLVKVVGVNQDQDYLEDLEQRLLRGEDVEIEPDVEATMQVERAFGDRERCSGDDPERPGQTFTMAFFSEVHSSHPREGERAVVFPARRGGRWMEAIYGRSYWEVRCCRGTWHVQVTWRNDFLLDEPTRAQPDSKCKHVQVGLEVALEAWEDAPPEG